MADTDATLGIETALVTGAIGNVGSWVVDHLADRGVRVVGVDLDRPAGSRMYARFRDVDLRNQAETWETLQEVDPDVIIHLAALSDPVNTPGTRVFSNNVTATYNVLVAAGRAGTDVVWTSSQAAYGALFSGGQWTPDYLPIDEVHPLRPTDPYGTSKACGERIAAMAARRYDIAVTTIRPATIITPERSRARPTEDGVDLREDDTSGDFGSYVDVRDVARLIEAVIRTDHDGHEIVHCVADENYLGEPTAEIVDAVCGTLPAECDLDGLEAAYSNAKAERLFDWTPAHEVPEHDLETLERPDWL